MSIRELYLPFSMEATHTCRESTFANLSIELTLKRTIEEHLL